MPSRHINKSSLCSSPESGATCEMDPGCAQSYSGGSVGGAVKLNHGQADVVINWSGGLHHAKKAEVLSTPCAS